MAKVVSASFFVFLIFTLLNYLLALPGLLAFLLINFGELWRLLVVLPHLTIILCVDLKLFALRHDVANCREERPQDKVNESWLPLGDPSCVAIT